MTGPFDVITPRKLLLTVSLVAASIASSAAAQVYEPTYEKVLVPVPSGTTAGAFGSRWRAAIAVSNISDTPVDVQGHGDCRLGIPCRPAPIPPQTTIYINQILRSEVPAAFLNVERGRVDDLSITMRTFDQSREHLTWGAAGGGCAAHVGGSVLRGDLWAVVQQDD